MTEIWVKLVNNWFTCNIIAFKKVLNTFEVFKIHFQIHVLKYLTTLKTIIKITKSESARGHQQIQGGGNHDALFSHFVILHLSPHLHTPPARFSRVDLSRFRPSSAPRSPKVVLILPPRRLKAVNSSSRNEFFQCISDHREHTEQRESYRRGARGVKWHDDLVFDRGRELAGGRRQGSASWWILCDEVRSY